VYLLSTSPIRAEEQNFFSWSSEHYQVLSDSSVTASMEIARKLEAALILFNDYLHYDLTLRTDPLRVRIFSEKQSYDEYLSRLISETRTDFVFISYSDPGRSELVGFQREEEDFGASLLHYGFIQFLSAFVPNAPLWIEEGMATYLEYSAYDPVAESYRWRSNYAWLESLKSILQSEESPSAIALEELLFMDKEQAQNSIEVFYPTAWGLVHFLLQSTDKRHNRIIWEALASLDGSLNLRQNSLQVRDRAFSWIDLEELQRDFHTYSLSLMTFNDFIRQGVDLYSAEELAAARESFENAVAQRTDNYIPYYYLGLIYYQQKDYDTAQQYYSKASELDIEPGLINYALGVNAFADKRFDLAVEYLLKAKELDSAAYGEKVDSLLQRIEVMR